MNDHYLKIGRLAQSCDVSVDTLRFYEKEGLLTPSSRTQAGYRLYQEQDKSRVGFIVAAKKVGFTLSEIRELLELEITRDQHSCEQVKNLVDEKIVVVEQRLTELEAVRESLQSLSDACCGGDESALYCSILDTLAAREVHDGAVK